MNTTPDPMRSRKHTAWGKAKIVDWTLIILSALAFLVIMWIPHITITAIIIVTSIFLIGILGLFIVQSPNDTNPYLDENGTAV
ncbi:MAG: hypothetical protein IKS59_02520 [Aeriscardovia sp.]|nr:hypothetical protein [Aeriscardovia sp.]